jgi:uncharacterized protein YjdB
VCSFAACGGDSTTTPVAPSTTTTEASFTTICVSWEGKPCFFGGGGLNEGAQELAVGDTARLVAHGRYSDGSRNEITASWSSTDKSIATVNPSTGDVTGLAVGSVGIGFTAGTTSISWSGTFHLNVVAPPATVTSLSLSATSTTLDIGATTTITATATYSDATTAVVTPTWASSDTSVATITAAGEVTAVAAGSSTITGMFDGQTGTVGITVRAAVTVTGLSVSAGSTTIDVDATTTVSATATYSDSTTAVVTPTWTSSNTSVATVTAAGEVSGVTAGTSTITGTFEDQTGSVEITVNAVSAPSTTSGTSVVINEFRTRGPGGANDEFIELRNDSNASVEISGWQVHGSNSSGGTTNRRTIPSGTVLAAGCHYLLGNSRAYTGATDTTYGTGITDSGGIALKQANGSVVDQVGLSTGSAFKEGSPLSEFPSSNTNQSYKRTGNDTNNNASDFSRSSPSSPLTSSSSCSVR